MYQCDNCEEDCGEVYLRDKKWVCRNCQYEDDIAEAKKKEIKKVVGKIVKDYGGALRRLGK